MKKIFFVFGIFFIFFGSISTIFAADLYPPANFTTELRDDTATVLVRWERGDNLVGTRYCLEKRDVTANGEWTLVRDDIQGIGLDDSGNHSSHVINYRLQAIYESVRSDWVSSSVTMPESTGNGNIIDELDDDPITESGESLNPNSTAAPYIYAAELTQKITITVSYPDNKDDYDTCVVEENGGDRYLEFNIAANPSGLSFNIYSCVGLYVYRVKLKNSTNGYVSEWSNVQEVIACTYIDPGDNPVDPEPVIDKTWRPMEIVMCEGVEANSYTDDPYDLRPINTKITYGVGEIPYYLGGVENVYYSHFFRRRVEKNGKQVAEYETGWYTVGANGQGLSYFQGELYGLGCGDFILYIDINFGDGYIEVDSQEFSIACLAHEETVFEDTLWEAGNLYVCNDVVFNEDTVDEWDTKPVEERYEFVEGDTPFFYMYIRAYADCQFRWRIYRGAEMIREYTGNSYQVESGTSWGLPFYGSFTMLAFGEGDDIYTVSVEISIEGNDFVEIESKTFTITKTSPDYVLVEPVIAHGSETPTEGDIYDLQPTGVGEPFGVGDRMYFFFKLRNVYVPHRIKLELFKNDLPFDPIETDWIMPDPVNSWSVSVFNPYLNFVKAGTYEARFYLQTGDDYELIATKIVDVISDNIEFPYCENFSEGFGRLLLEDDLMNTATMTHGAYGENKNGVLINNTTAHTEAYYVQEKIVGMLMFDGIEYTGAIKLRASTPGEVYLTLQRDIDPYERFDFWDPIIVTTEWQVHEFSFTANAEMEADPDNVRFSLLSGTLAGDLYIDSLMIKEVPVYDLEGNLISSKRSTLIYKDQEVTEPIEEIDDSDSNHDSEIELDDEVVESSAGSGGSGSGCFIRSVLF